MRNDNPKATTTDASIPVVSDEYSLMVGPDGLFLQDHSKGYEHVVALWPKPHASYAAPRLSW